jgi:hypothetical protein
MIGALVVGVPELVKDQSCTSVGRNKVVDFAKIKWRPQAASTMPLFRNFGAALRSSNRQQLIAKFNPAPSVRHYRVSLADCMR